MSGNRVKCQFYGRGCKRTAKRGNEIICGRHWKILDPDLRRQYTITKRRARKFEGAYDRSSADRQRCIGPLVDRAWEAFDEVWEKIKAEIDFKLANGFEEEMKSRRRRPPKLKAKRATTTELLREAGL